MEKHGTLVAKRMAMAILTTALGTIVIAPETRTESDVRVAIGAATLDAIIPGGRVRDAVTSSRIALEG